MNSLIKFIEKYQFVLLFLLLEVLSFWLLANHTYYQRTKFENLTRKVSGYVYDKVDGARRYFSLAQTNKQLASQNLDLRNQIAMLSSRIEKHNIELADTITHSQFRFIPAKIINNSINKQYNYLTLNAGRNDGIEEEMGVVTSQGIVGIVAGVSKNYSTVISLLNIDLKISAKLKKSNHFGSLFWDGRNYREVLLTDIPQHVQLSLGDTIITSGFSPIFPPDINLGTIKSFDSKGSNFHTIKINLFNDFKKIENVWVVENIHGEEREELEEKIMQN